MSPIDAQVRDHYAGLALSPVALAALKAHAGRTAPTPRGWHRYAVAALVLLSAVGVGLQAGAGDAWRVGSPIPAPPPIRTAPPTVAVPEGYRAVVLPVAGTPRARLGDWVDLYHVSAVVHLDLPVMWVDGSEGQITVAIPATWPETWPQDSSAVAAAAPRLKVVTLALPEATTVSFGDWIRFEDAAGKWGEALVLWQVSDEITLGVPADRVGPTRLARIRTLAVP